MPYNNRGRGSHRPSSRSRGNSRDQHRNNQPSAPSTSYGSNGSNYYGQYSDQRSRSRSPSFHHPSAPVWVPHNNRYDAYRPWPSQAAPPPPPPAYAHGHWEYPQSYQQNFHGRDDRHDYRRDAGRWAGQGTGRTQSTYPRRDLYNGASRSFDYGQHNTYRGRQNQRHTGPNNNRRRDTLSRTRALSSAQTPPEQAHDEPESQTFRAMSRPDMLRVVKEQGHNALPPLPLDRSQIWHFGCDRAHAPEECRGPCGDGAIESCVLCGGSDHLTDVCPYWGTIPLLQRPTYELYLYMYSRQSLPPLRSTRTFQSQAVGEGHLCARPPLSTKSVKRHLEKVESDDFKKSLPYWERFDYDALENMDVEIHRLPPTDPALGEHMNHGPLPNKHVDWVWSHYDRKLATPYDNDWTLFANEHIKRESASRRSVTLPEWVTAGTSLPAIIPSSGGLDSTSFPAEMSLNCKDDDDTSIPSSIPSESEDTDEWINGANRKRKNGPSNAQPKAKKHRTSEGVVDPWWHSLHGASIFKGA